MNLQKKEFQDKSYALPFRETKKAQREPVISGLNELINQFSTKKYDSEEIALVILSTGSCRLNQDPRLRG